MTDRKTFTIPDGHVAVRDSDGRATGETAPAPTELLPCPFCGGKAVVKPYGGDAMLFKAECQDCTAFIRGFDQCAQDAADAWNTRQAASVERAELPSHSYQPSEYVFGRCAVCGDLPAAKQHVERADACAKCGHPRSEHSYNGACYGLCGKFIERAEVAGEAKRITGCINQVEEAACLIWDELCPGMVMGDADLPHYEAAAKAVLALPHAAQAPWMPIETAPRDGTRIFVTGGGVGPEIDIASYNESVGAWNIMENTLDDRDDEPDGYSRPAFWKPLSALALPSAEGK